MVSFPVPLPLSEFAINQLRSHDWPGNIRELENVIRRSLLLARKQATLEKVEMIATSASHPIKHATKPIPEEINLDNEMPLKERLAEFEINLIQQTLDQFENNISAVARALSMPRTTLLSRMKSLGIK